MLRVAQHLVRHGDVKKHERALSGAIVRALPSVGAALAAARRRHRSTRRAASTVEALAVGAAVDEAGEPRATASPLPARKRLGLTAKGLAARFLLRLPSPHA